MEEPQTPSMETTDKGIDEPVLLKEHMRLGPFKMQFLEGKTKPLLGETAHVMVFPLKVDEAQPAGTHHLPLGLHVLHMYMQWWPGSLSWPFMTFLHWMIMSWLHKCD